MDELGNNDQAVDNQNEATENPVEEIQVPEEQQKEVAAESEVNEEVLSTQLPKPEVAKDSLEENPIVEEKSEDAGTKSEPEKKSLYNTAHDLRGTLNNLSNKVTELISLQTKVIPSGDFYSNARKMLSDRIDLLKQSIQFTLKDLGRTVIQ